MKARKYIIIKTYHIQGVNETDAITKLSNYEALNLQDQKLVKEDIYEKSERG